MNEEKSEHLSRFIGSLSRGTFNSSDAKEFKNEFDTIISDIDNLIRKDSDEALGMLAALVIVINEAIKKDKSILDKLYKWIKKLKERFDKIVRATHGESYSISIGIGGVSVSVSFRPSE